MRGWALRRPGCGIHPGFQAGQSDQLLGAVVIVPSMCAEGLPGLTGAEQYYAGSTPDTSLGRRSYRGCRVAWLA